MNTKKTVIALAAGMVLASAVPAMADHSMRGATGHNYRGQAERRLVVERPSRPAARKVVVHRPSGRPAVVARPVFVQRQPAVVYHEPTYYAAPVYRAAPVAYEPADNAIGTIGGAILGAAIGNQIGHGDERAATTVIGAFIGGMIGSGL